VDLVIRPFEPADVDPLAVAFRDWPKDRSLFVGYAERAAAGEIDWVVAELDGTVVGFLYLLWRSGYPPFAAAAVPEICDFNVLPPARRHGVGAALMDEAERLAGERSDTVGLGVGLYRDYGSAQRMYVKRGYVPDGAGLVIGETSVPPGTMIRLDDEPGLKFTKRLRP
jgi:GNAT superfamily N-acetyltransferase